MIFLYVVLWKDVCEIQLTPWNHSKHHVKNNFKKSEEDLLDTVIDWECARMTKPDKPLNAYETLMKFFRHIRQNICRLFASICPIR